VSVKIRLTRGGRKKQPFYRIIISDSRNRRDGAYLEQVGVYHPKKVPAHVQINEVRVLAWLQQGATPSETVRSLLSKQGVMLRLHLLKKDMAPDQIEERLTQFRTTADARATRRSQRKGERKKAKKAAEAPAA
jgi:small subunit ribosomal protein S16